MPDLSASPQFWVLALLFVAVALAFALPPLLRRGPHSATAERRDINIAVYKDQAGEIEAERDHGLLSEDQFQSARRELEARLAEDALAREEDHRLTFAGGRGLGYALAVVLPLAAFGLYFWLGNPAALDPAALTAAPQSAATGMHDIEKMVRQAEAKVQSNPKDGVSWAMLARSYVALQRWPEAWKAYQFASELKPDDASLLAGQAEALAVMKGGALAGEPMRLVNRALALDPNDTKGLELAAAHAFQGRDFARAASFLEKLHKLLPADDPFARQVLAALNQARQLTQTGALDNLSGQPAPSPAPTQPAAATIRGSIELASALGARLGGQDVIFLFARSANGGPPVAVVRGPAARFPMDFELSDRWAMNPDNPLSRHKRVTLVARISKSGAPMGQSGDLEGSLEGVAVGAQGVKLVIDRVIP